MGSRSKYSGPDTDWAFTPGKTQLSEGPDGEMMNNEKTRPANEADRMLAKYADDPGRLKTMRTRQIDANINRDVAFEERQNAQADGDSQTNNISIAEHLKQIQDYRNQ